MKIVEVTVTFGRTVPSDLIAYSNYKPEITLKAKVEEGENADEVAVTLQDKAEQLVNDYVEHRCK